MFSKIALSACLLAVASAIPAGPPAPYHPAPAAYAPEPILPPVYNYEYGVNDGYSGAVFSQKENRDNYNTAGEYRVNLPDGRVQIVSYTAGPEGYVADVTYEGVAAYPEYKPAAHPAPAYKAHPAPAYKPAPAPVYKPAPAPVYKAAPVYKPAPAPYHPAPAYKPAPYHPAPAYKPHPAPYHAAPVYHPAPAPYKPRTKYTFKTVAPPAPVVKTEEAVEVVPVEVAEVAEEVAE